jgi:cytidine deaminase
VGAALLASDGQIFTGCNVENASYGLTCCAERVAIFSAVAAGCRAFEAIAVASERGAAPCGACRQVMREFARDLVIHVAAADGRFETRRLSDLFPESFGPDDLAVGG